MVQDNLKALNKSYRVLKQGANVGFANGHNTGYKETTAPYILLQNPDMYLMPDPDTYALLPWRNDIESGRVARVICDVYKPDHQPFEGDPRFILKSFKYLCVSVTSVVKCFIF